MIVLESQIIPKLETPQQVISATTMLCEDNFKGMVQRMLLGHARDLIAVDSTDTTAPGVANVNVPPPLTHVQDKPQNQVQTKKRLPGLGNISATPDVGFPRAPKRIKKEFPAKEGVTHSLSTKPITHCVCNATENDRLLVQCDGCDKWYHPVCIGKGGYDAETVKQHKIWTMEMDVAKLAGDQVFKCLECDEKQA